MNRLTQEYLRENYTYEPETGEFYRKGKTPRSYKGKEYRYCTVLGVCYRVHRLVWFYVYGEWPELIDHINRCKWDNRLKNLRSTSPLVNSRNSLHPTGATEYRGVYKRGEKYRARIEFNNEQKYLGTYDTPEVASKVYEAVRQVLDDLA